MSRQPPQPLVGTGDAPRFAYGIAIVAVLLAGVATALFHRVAPERSLSLVFFFAAVAISAGIGGLGPGVVATLLSALIYDYFFLLPLHSLAVADRDLPLLVLFMLIALLINGLSGRLHAGTRAADQRFRDLVQGLEAIVWEANPTTLHFAFVSQRAEDILGYPVAQWLSTPNFRVRLLYPEDRAEIMAAFREALTRSGDSSLEYRVRAADGREVWLQETVHVVCNERGQPVRLSGFCVDITERKRARERLHQLSRRLVHLQEAERREITRELHDEIGQVLTGLKLTLEMSARLPPQEAQPSLRGALDRVHELMAHVQALSLDLRPAMLDDLGLLPTLLWHFERYSQTTGVQVHFEHTELQRRFAPELETTAYRIIQEALTNVARHAGVNEATVRLWTTRDFLEIEVVDNGRGFAVEETLAQARTAGLTGMEERAMLIGGRLSVESAPEAGTRLTAALPLSAPAAIKGDTDGDVANRAGG